MEFDFPLSFPIVVNSTDGDNGVWYKLVIDDQCIFPEAYPAQLIRVWDRQGLVHDEVVAVDETRLEQWLWIPLPGNPPWIVAGEAYSCINSHQSRLYNVSSGYHLVDRGYNQNKDLNFDHVPFILNAGEQHSEVFWRGSEYTWSSRGTAPDIDEGRGSFIGSIQMLYPDDSIARNDRYDAGNHEASFQPHMFLPGDYRIIVEADIAAVEPLRGNYIVGFMQFHNKICDYGFLWKGLCS